MTYPLAIKGLALAVAVSILPAGPVFGAQAAVVVGVRVTLISTSGSCAAQQAQFGFDVVCGRPVIVSPGGSGGMFGANRGSVGFNGQLVGTVPRDGYLGSGDAAATDGAGGRAAQGVDGELVTEAGLPLRRPDGLYRYNSAEISSWRMVSSHNRDYVELTIAW
ncbi:MAG TPA: hypothetical protein VIL30_06565 [Ramlibacter sp.]|jgi:hypothetical protein